MHDVESLRVRLHQSIFDGVVNHLYEMPRAGWTAVEETFFGCALSQRVARRARLIPLSEVADVRVVDGPATIKGENGLPRNYVRLNVRDRDVAAENDRIWVDLEKAFN